jgi:hypothetical protein
MPRPQLGKAAAMLTSEDAYLRAAASAALLGTPFLSLVDAVYRQADEEAAAKVISLAEMSRTLRPSAPNGVETDA